jgi:hypothetical protein
LSTFNSARVHAGALCLALLLLSIGAVAPSIGWASDPSSDWVRPQILPDPVEPPVTLIPQDGNTSTTRPKGVTTNAVTTPRKYTIQASPGWASIRSSAHSWFIGSAQTGMTLNAFNPDPAHPEDADSRMGYITERNMCGWLLTQSITNQNSTGVSQCGSNWSLGIGSASQMINCDSCNGGYSTNLLAYTCYVRNAYPWWTGPDYPPGQPLDFTVCNNAGHQVYWRYVSANGQWVAISDPNYAMTWFFVPRSALPANICTVATHPSGVWPGANTCSPTQ